MISVTTLLITVTSLICHHSTDVSYHFAYICYHSTDIFRHSTDLLPRYWYLLSLFWCLSSSVHSNIFITSAVCHCLWRSHKTYFFYCHLFNPFNGLSVLSYAILFIILRSLLQAHLDDTRALWLMTPASADYNARPRRHAVLRLRKRLLRGRRRQGVTIA